MSLKWHLPLMLFDDAGPTSQTSSTFVRCLYSLLGVGSEGETRFLVATSLKEQGLPDESWTPLMNSFEELAQPTEADAATTRQRSSPSC